MCTKNTEHNHSYIIMILDIKAKKLEEVAVEHCILCGKEREE